MLEVLQQFLANPSTQIALSGAMGGAVRWLRLKEPFSEGLRLITIGSICAYYVSRPIFPLFDPIMDKALTDEYVRLTFVGFMIGFSGSNIWGLYTDIMQARRHMQNNSPKDEAK